MNDTLAARTLKAWLLVMGGVLAGLLALAVFTSVIVAIAGAGRSADPAFSRFARHFVQFAVDAGSLLPLAAVFACVVAGAAAIRPRLTARTRSGSLRFCQSCEYDLSNLPASGVCPECGAPMTHQP